MRHHSIPVFRNAIDLYASIGAETAAAMVTADLSFCNLGDVLSRGHAVCAAAYRTAFYSFFFIKHASGQLTLNQQAYEVAPGSVCCSHPGDVTAFDLRDVQELYLLTFSESFLKQYTHPGIMEEFPFLQSEGLPAMALENERFTEFERLYEQISLVHLSASPLHKKQIGYLLLLILLKIKENLSNVHQLLRGQGRQTDIVRSFKQMLRQHYQDLYNGLVEHAYHAREYADALGMHPNYLNQVIREKTGMPVSKWIIDKTIAESKLLLAYSNLSIKEIAFRLGFAEPSYFCRYFKRYTKTTAAEYRKTRDGAHTLTGTVTPLLTPQTLTA